MSERFEHHARTVSLLTGISRVTGLARDATLSRIFGAAGVTDAFFLAFMVPNLFRRLFGEGALAAAFLPAYAGLDRDDPAAARRLASITVSALVIVLGLVVLLAEGALWLASRRAGHENLALSLTMIMLPYMPMVCIVAILGAMLQVLGRFGPVAAAPIIVNLCLIATALGVPLLLAPMSADVGGDDHARLHIAVVAVSVVIAGVLQVGWCLLALRGLGWWTRRMRSAIPALRRVAKQAIPMIVGLGVLQLNTLLDGLIASYPTAVGATIFGIDYPLAEGAMASVSFAQRLYQFPLGVFGLAVATAIFPALARSSDATQPFAETLRRGLRLVVFIGAPASVGLVLVRTPLTAVILEGGRFTASDSARVGFVLLGYAPAVWAYSMIHVLTRAFYARGDTASPVKVAVCVVVLNLALNCSLIWTALREAGLAWSTALCAVVQVTVLLRLARRHTEATVTTEVLVSWFKSMLAAAVMGGAVWIAATLLDTGTRSWLQSLGVLLALVAAGVAVFAATARALRMPEGRWLLHRAPSG